MMRTLALRLIALLALLAPLSGESNDGGLAQPVSLVRLIADPRSFDGTKVTVIGFLHVGFETTALYLHEEDFKHQLLDNGVNVDSSDSDDVKNLSRFSDRYVLIEATFTAPSTQLADQRSGTLAKVTRLRLWPPKSGKQAPTAK